MFYNIEGKITYTDPNFVVVQCGGVGFKCFTSLNTVKNVGSVGKNINLFTYLAVKDDALDLYGFIDSAELEFFKLLISVSGIGPKAAISLLSELTPDQLAISIASGDYKTLTKAQGIGKKTAERAILELKSKMSGFQTSSGNSDFGSIQSVTENSTTFEAVEALVALGFNQSDATVAVSQMDKSLKVDDMIREGLKLLSSKL